MTNVVTSRNDATGMRCIDILCQSDGRYHWQECRRDPEDSHGWRVILSCNDQSFGTEAQGQWRGRPKRLAGSMPGARGWAQ